MDVFTQALVGSDGHDHLASNVSHRVLQGATIANLFTALLVANLEDYHLGRVVSVASGKGPLSRIFTGVFVVTS